MYKGKDNETGTGSEGRGWGGVTSCCSVVVVVVAAAVVNCCSCKWLCSDRDSRTMVVTIMFLDHSQF